MELIYTILSAIFGYTTLRATSRPNSRIHRNLPNIKIKNVELLPSIRITIRGHVIHIHHWFHFTLLLCISIFVTGGILDSWLTRGFLMGGIAQGLRFSDRSIFSKKSE